MRKNDVAAILNREITQARGYDSDVLSTRRAAALDMYAGIMQAAPEGRSQVVSLDIADAVHAVLAQISPIVRSSRVEFEAMSQQDEQQANTETDFVRIEIERAGGCKATDEATFDALLQGNGWLYPWVDESTTVTETTLPGQLSDEQVFAAQQAFGPDAKVTIRQGKEEARIRIETTKRTLRIECVPPEEMLYSECGADFDVEQLRFVGRARLYTVSQLLDMGFKSDLVLAIPDATNDQQGERAREGVYQNDGNLDAAQTANSLKMVYCCYLRLADEGSNKTQLRHIWIGENGTEPLRDEPATHIPYICGSAIPMPHRITGTSLYDMLAEIQRGKTHVLRQYFDNLAVMNASRIGAVEGQVNMTDLTNGRINGVVRLRSPDALVPLPAADIGPQAISALEYMDSIRTQRIGASVDFNEVQAQLMSTSATAAAGQLSKVEQMGGWFASNIVRTMVLPLYKAIHRIMREEIAAPVMARVGGKWQQTDTSQWQERTVTDVQMGMTTTEKAERMNALQQLIAQQQQMLMTGGGGIITDLSRLYGSMSDWIRTAGLGSPDQYLIDPTSHEAQQAQQQAAQSQQAQLEQQAQIQASIVKLEQNFELEKQRRDLEYKVWSDKLQAEVDEAKIVGNGVIELKKAKLSTPADKGDDRAAS